MKLYARYLEMAAFCGLACALASCGSALSPSALAASGWASVGLSTTSLSAGSIAVGTTSQATGLYVTNVGNAALAISSVTLTGPNPGDFTLNNGCTSPVAPGANCQISLTFTPTAAGSRKATINVADNASGSPQTATISGTGMGQGSGATARLSASSLSFGSVAAGNTSAPQTVTVSNTGNRSLSISSIGLTGANTGDFAESNNCGYSVGAGRSCAISVTFRPAASGSFTAAVTLSDSASGSTQTVNLSGTGSSISASTNNTTVTLSPSSLAFGNQATDTTSSLQSVTLSNTGSSALTISNLSVTGTNAGEFTQNNNCNSSVAAGGSCTIGVLFTPSASGSATASVQVTSSTTGSPQVVTLSGTGTHDVILTWTSAATGNVAGYNVFRGTWPGGEGSTPLNSSPVNGTSYTDSGVSSGVTYYYVLKAVGAGGNQGAASNEMSATVPTP